MKPDCHRLARKLSALLDEELAGPELEEVLGHLEQCPLCRNCLKTLRRTREMLRQAPGPELPPGLKQRLKACLREPEP